MNIYIGYDSREDLAYQVCNHSIKSRSKAANIFPFSSDDIAAIEKAPLSSRVAFIKASRVEGESFLFHIQHHILKFVLQLKLHFYHQ